MGQCAPELFQQRPKIAPSTHVNACQCVLTNSGACLTVSLFFLTFEPAVPIVKDGSNMVTDASSISNSSVFLILSHNYCDNYDLRGSEIDKGENPKAFDG